MAYSKEMILSNTSNHVEYRDPEEPIIQFENDKKTIRSLDRYGKATVIMEEENQQAHQVVMLNIFITDIY